MPKNQKNAKKNASNEESGPTASFTFPKKLAERIDAIYPKHGFSSRAGFIKYAIHKLLEEYEAPLLED